MGEFSASDASWACLRPHGLDAIWRGFKDVHGIGPGEGLLGGGDTSSDAFPREGMTNEHDAPVLVTGDAGPAVRRRINLKLKNLLFNACCGAAAVMAS